MVTGVLAKRRVILARVKRTGVGLLAGAALLIGCGGESPPSEEPSTSRDELIRELNESAIDRARTAPDAVAQRGEAAVRRVLRRKLDMSQEGDFRLNPDEPTECEREVAEEEAEYGIELECSGEEADCYVKTGAEAVAFQEESQNILYAPNGKDLVFVQTFQGTPLHQCLVAVRDALDW